MRTKKEIIDDSEATGCSDIFQLVRVMRPILEVLCDIRDVINKGNLLNPSKDKA